eukprot:TRINITY_DN5032_c0_g3_i1.p1 TRINITY_DN5032_c0_g3~~TRINITY_DN5032_c0_g3_i1.p1  ORF type:complete len:154 (+),score=38.28 TRINITY_DN5032_c0_g3_i1:38-463(+)
MVSATTALAATTVAIGGYAIDSMRKEIMESGVPAEAKFRKAEGESNTLVLVFGWAGCLWKQLDKILDWYQKVAKLDTISAIAPFPSTVPVVNPVLEVVSQQSHHDRVVVHAFSQNGSSTFIAILERLEKEPFVYDKFFLFY